MSNLFQLVHASDWDQIRLSVSLPNSLQCSICSHRSCETICRNCGDIRMDFSSIGRYNHQITLSDECGCTPFHYVCASKNVPADIVKAMMNIRKNCFMTLDNDRNTPLHGACANGSYSTVQMLLEEGKKKIKEMICKKNAFDYTPMDVVWLMQMEPYFYLLDIDYLADSRTVASNVSRINEIHTVKNLTGNLDDLWNKTTLLLYASHFGSMNPPLGGSQWQVIHVIAGSGGGDKCYCPSVVMWFALKLYSYQVRQQDENGNLPLHIAASSPIHPILDLVYKGGEDEDNTMIILNETYEETRVPVLQMLIRKYPEGAKVQNRDGRLPLNLAIESGKTWENGIKLLVDTAPQSLACKDMKTRLYPFMLAAANEKSSLDLVFRLLYTNPEIVRSGIKDTHQERYLKRKITKYEEEIALLKSKIAKLEKNNENASN